MYFNLDEFQRSSVRPLSDRERFLAKEWESLLDPIREAYGGPILVTSFVRNTGAHAYGEAVDIQPLFGLEPQIKAVADYAAALHLPSGRVRQVIYEAPEPGQFRGHVHIARELVAGARAGYLADYTGTRQYVSRSIPDLARALSRVRYSGGLLLWVLGGAAAYLLSRSI